MSTFAQSLGITTATWGSIKLNFVKGASFSMGGYIATPVIAGNTITNSLQLVAAKVMGKFPLTPGMSLAAIRALNGQAMIVTADTGQKYVINGATLSKDIITTDGPGGNNACEWSGQPAAEVLP